MGSSPTLASFVNFNPSKEPMISKQPQAAPPLVEVGGTIELLGHLFVVAAHAPNKNGVMVEVPGKHLGPVPRHKQNKRAGQAAIAPSAANGACTHAQPAATQAGTRPAAPRQRKASRPRAPRGDYRQFRQKPPPLIIHQEPWGLTQWVGMITVVALVVLGIWLSSAGSEAKKWQSIEAVSRAIQGR